MKCLIINNNFLGMVRQWQQLFYENRLSGVDLEGNPDFVKLAQAYGIKALRIRRPADADRILREAHEHDGPCLVVAEVVQRRQCLPDDSGGRLGERNVDREAQTRTCETQREHMR